MFRIEETESILDIESFNLTGLDVLITPATDGLLGSTPSPTAPDAPAASPLFSKVSLQIHPVRKNDTLSLFVTHIRTTKRQHQENDGSIAFWNIWHLSKIL